MAGQAHPAARAIRAARSLSRSRVWLVPENTSISPDLASRTCSTRGPDVAFAVPPLPGDGWLVAAAAGLAAAPRPVAPAVATPCSIERRDRRRPDEPARGLPSLARSAGARLAS